MREQCSETRDDRKPQPVFQRKVSEAKCSETRDDRKPQLPFWPFLDGLSVVKRETIASRSCKTIRQFAMDSVAKRETIAKLSCDSGTLRAVDE